MTRVTLLSFLSDVDVGDECFDAKPATVGDLKLNLPLDEDDYLMPSPQQTESTTTYMDIIGDKSTGEYKKKMISYQRLFRTLSHRYIILVCSRRD